MLGGKFISIKVRKLKTKQQKGFLPEFQDTLLFFINTNSDLNCLRRKDFFDNVYHKPTDTVRPDWDLSGGVEDLQLYWMVGYLVAQGEKYPQWKPGAEFGIPRGPEVR